MAANRGKAVVNSDFALALSFPPLNARREVELVTGYTQLLAVIHHLGVPFRAIAGNPKDLVGEGDVVDVLVLEIRVPGVRVLRVEGFAEAFSHLRGPLVEYGDPMDGPLFDPGSPVLWSNRLYPSLEDGDLRKHAAVLKALLNDVTCELSGIFSAHLPPPVRYRIR